MNILEVQILSADIKQTKQFYHDILGMDILFYDDNQLKLSAGLSTLIFKNASIPDARYHFAFNIPANQFNEACDWANAHLTLLSVKDDITIADFASWNAKAFYFYDNNQNIVEFIARFDLSNDSTKPFDGSSICSISEMGLVADNATLLCKQLMNDYNLNYFSKQASQEDFIALGDDNGLFIIVSEKRKWYPTGQLSGQYDSTIKFSHAGRVHVLEMKGS